jgi:hypothetical protein
MSAYQQALLQHGLQGLLLAILLALLQHGRPQAAHRGSRLALALAQLVAVGCLQQSHMLDQIITAMHQGGPQVKHWQHVTFTTHHVYAPGAKSSAQHRSAGLHSTTGVCH